MKKVNKETKMSRPINYEADQQVDYENDYEDLFEYDGDIKRYIGHPDVWYFDTYHNHMSKQEAFDMLVRAIRKYVNHARELECVGVDHDWMTSVLDSWFEHDHITNDYFDHLFPEIEDSDDGAFINDIVIASRIFYCFYFVS